MKNKVFILVVVLCLSMFMLASYANAQEVEVKYGNSKVIFTLVDDFDNSTGLNESMKIENSTLILKRGSFVDTQDIKDPEAEANKGLYANAKYIMLSLANKGEDSWFCFQPKISTQGKYLTPQGTDKIFLLNAEGVRTEVEWKENVSNRWAFKLPKGFEGYAVIPVTSFTTHNVWGTPTWVEGDYITSAGFHVANVADNFQPVHVEVSDMYLTSLALPTYEAPSTEPETVPNTETGDNTMLVSISVVLITILALFVVMKKKENA